MNRTWIILGATSSMARAFARQVASQGAGVLLAGRDGEDLAALAADCALRGARLAEAVAFDARDPAGFAAIVDRAGLEEGEINAACWPAPCPRRRYRRRPGPDRWHRNAAASPAPARFLHLLARDRGTGDGQRRRGLCRGRGDDYVYGAAKAGFPYLLKELRNRLTRAGGHVVAVQARLCRYSDDPGACPACSLSPRPKRWRPTSCAVEQQPQRDLRRSSG